MVMHGRCQCSIQNMQGMPSASSLIPITRTHNPETPMPYPRRSRREWRARQIDSRACQNHALWRSVDMWRRAPSPDEGMWQDVSWMARLTPAKSPRATSCAYNSNILPHNLSDV